MTENASPPGDRTHRPAGFQWRRVAIRVALLTLLAATGLFVMSISATPPDNLGAEQGRLAPCPDSPNCVSTQASRDDQKMKPIPFSGDPATALETIKRTVKQTFPRSRLVEETDNYLRYEFTSLVFRFVDDVEFLVDDEQQRIHFRSASRVGYSDMGTNRNRMKKLTTQLQSDRSGVNQEESQP